MFRYYVEKFFFQIITVAALAGFIGVFVYAYSLEGNSPPPVNVQSEFSDSLGKPQVDEQEAGPLANQHLSEREIAEYLNEIVAMSLSFTPSTYQSVTDSVSLYFTPQAYEQYKAFLAKIGFERYLNGGYKAGAFLERPPLKLNSLLHNGAYKWLFEVPVTVTFLPSSTNSYEGANMAKPQNQRFTLRVQFTRLSDPNDPNRIAIEIWQALPPRG